MQPIALGRSVHPRTAFFAVAVNGGTIWAGGEATQPGNIGTVVSIKPGRENPLPELHHFSLPRQRQETRGEIVDIAMDAQARQHFLFLVRNAQGIVGGGDMVRDPEFPERTCQTVNVARDDDYPLHVPHPTNPSRRLRSPSTRLVAAGGSRVWLYGSDGGIARVADTLRNGQCGAVEVTYDAVLQRPADGLLSNTVPALVVTPGAASPRWFGTIRGLQDSQFNAFRFAPDRPAFRDVTTLEQYFGQVAAALFAARPLASERLGDLPFPGPLIKEDLVFSLLEDRRGRLWIGTLGGGLRCHGRACPVQSQHLQRCNPSPQSPERLQCNGLPSNLVIALAEGSDGAIWAATTAGASRIVADAARATVTTFATLDGLAAPVWDVAVDGEGTVWFATADGLFRLLPQGERLTGRVLDAAGRPVAGVDVLVRGTPLRAVTDAQGFFVLANVPLGAQLLIFDSAHVEGTPFSTLEWSIFVVNGTQDLPPVQLTHSLQLTAQAQESSVPVNVAVGLIAQVTDRGVPVAGRRVHFRVMGGSAARVDREMVSTNAEGQAITTVNVRARGPHQIEISSGRLAPVRLTVVGTARQDSVTLRIRGNTQLGVRGQVLDEPLVVQVLDELGKPMPDVIVTSQVLSGEDDEGFVTVDNRECTMDCPKRQTRRTPEDDPEARANFRLKVGRRSRTVRMRIAAMGVSTEFRIDVTRFLTGNGPMAVAVAALDGDKNLDIITANADSNNVSFLLGQGNGTFEDVKHCDVGQQPTAIAVADLNRDGVLDVVTTNAASHDVSVLLGRTPNANEPCPVFLPESRVQLDGMDVRPKPIAIAVTDINKDGRPDLVTANAKSGNVAILLGNGDGTFAPARFVGVGAAQQPMAVAVADLNGDGRLDLVTANVTANHDGAGDSLSHNLAILLRRENGAFVLEPLLRVGPASTAVAVADLDADNRPDLIVTTGDTDDVMVLRGRGDGTFTAAQRWQTGDRPVALAVADLDEDGRLDVVAADADSGDVAVLLGQNAPDSLFVTKPRQLEEVGARPVAIALTARDNDGSLAIVTANADSHDVVILSGANGTFTAEQRLTVGMQPTAVAVAHLNSDRWPDVVTANKDSCDVSVLFGRHDGSWASEQRAPVGSGRCPVAIAVTPRIVVTANATSNDVTVLLGRDAGTFAPARHFPVGMGRRPSAVAVADFNGDGVPDLVTANEGSDNVAVLLGQPASAGTFAAAGVFPIGKEPMAVAVADLNRDGRQDVITVNAMANSITVLLGWGNGAFAPPRHLENVGDTPMAVAVTDFNGDGAFDLVTANAESNDVTVLLGRGDGTLAFVPRIDVDQRPTAVAVAEGEEDLNNDGKSDVVTANANANTITLLRGDGKGGFFKTRHKMVCGERPVAIAVADLDRDGWRDLITANVDSDDIAIMRGRVGGTFSAAECFPKENGKESLQRPLAVAVADLDGDNALDIITANAASDNVAIFWGKKNYDNPEPVPLGTACRCKLGNRTDRRRPVALAVADLNRDAIPDLIIANEASNDVSILRGLGQGLFDTSRNCVPVCDGRRPTAIAVAAGEADLNRDGRPDLVTANTGSSNLSILLQGTKNDTFALASPVGLNGAGRPQAVVVADLDGDRRSDLVIATAGSDDIVVLRGNGDGTFAPGQRFRVRDRPLALAVADLNGDGALDVVTANANSDDVVVLFGLGDGTFTIVNP